MKNKSILELVSSKSTVINNRIHEIANELGEELVEYLGAGSFGYSFRTKSNKVLKITSDENEAHIAYKLSKKKNWLKYLINYYNVGLISPKKVYNQSMNQPKEVYIAIDQRWYILMDFVQPLTHDEKLAIDCYMKPMQYNFNYYSDILDKDDVMDNIDFMYNPNSYYWKDAEHPEKVHQIAIDFYPKILNIAKELKRKGILKTDFHSGNIGWDIDHENLVLYDLGGSDERYVNNFKDEIITTEKIVTKFKNFNK
jgi:hypothetical protein